MAATLLFISFLIGLVAMGVALLRRPMEALYVGVLSLYVAFASLAFSKPGLAVPIVIAMAMTGALFFAILATVNSEKRKNP